MLPNLFNFNEVTLVNLIQIVATLFLGFAAIYVSARANKIRTQSMEHEKKMSVLKVKIALFKQRIDVLITLEKAVYAYDTDKIDCKILLSSSQTALYLFPKELASTIIDLSDSLYYFYKDNKTDDRYINKFAKDPHIAQLSENANGISMLSYYRLEYEEINKKCEALINLNI